jgi:hypothetical protein
MRSRCARIGVPQQPVLPADTLPITIAPPRERTTEIPARITRLHEKYSELLAKKLRGLTDKAKRGVPHIPGGATFARRETIERAVRPAPEGDFVAALRDALEREPGSVDDDRAPYSCPSVRVSSWNM